MDAKGCSPSQRSRPKEVRALPSWSMDIRAVSELRRMLEKPYFSKEMRRPDTWCCTNRSVCVRLPEAAKQVHTLLQKRLIWFTKLNSDINNAKKKQVANMIQVWILPWKWYGVRCVSSELLEFVGCISYYYYFILL